MSRLTRASRLVIPPLLMLGERETLMRERAEIISKLKRVRERAPEHAALMRSLVRVTARLLAINTAPIPGADRKDLQ